MYPSELVKLARLTRDRVGGQTLYVIYQGWPPAPYVRAAAEKFRVDVKSHKVNVIAVPYELRGIIPFKLLKGA